jgi:gas vesicle protein
MKDSGFGSFLSGLVVGGFVGAAVGMLLAPESGTRLREQVGEFVDGRREAFDEAINEGRVAAEMARAEMLGAPEFGSDQAGGASEASAS